MIYGDLFDNDNFKLLLSKLNWNDIIKCYDNIINVCNYNYIKNMIKYF